MYGGQGSNLSWGRGHWTTCHGMYRTIWQYVLSNPLVSEGKIVRDCISYSMRDTRSCGMMVYVPSIIHSGQTWWGMDELNVQQITYYLSRITTGRHQSVANWNWEMKKKNEGQCLVILILYYTTLNWSLDGILLNLLIYRVTDQTIIAPTHRL